MGRSKHIYSDIEKTQLMSETYCSAWCYKYIQRK
jgi:hypothetical protein